MLLDRQMPFRVAHFQEILLAFHFPDFLMISSLPIPYFSPIMCSPYTLLSTHNLLSQSIYNFLGGRGVLKSKNPKIISDLISRHFMKL